MNERIAILCQFYLCQLFFETGATQTDLAKLTSMSKVFSDTRKRLFYDKFTLRFDEKESYESAVCKGARRVVAHGAWVRNYPFNFEKQEKNLLLLVRAYNNIFVNGCC